VVLPRLALAKPRRMIAPSATFRGIPAGFASAPAVQPGLNSARVSQGRVTPGLPQYRPPVKGAHPWGWSHWA